MNPKPRIRIAVAVLAVLTATFAADLAARGVRGTTRTNVSGNVNVNRNTNVNVDRHVDVDVDADRHWDGDDHPIARAAAVGTAVAVTAAAIGSIAYSIPESCVPVDVNGVTYQQCGSTWYQPQYAGDSVQYVVVDAPG